MAPVQVFITRFRTLTNHVVRQHFFLKKAIRSCSIITFTTIPTPAEGVHPRESSLQGCDSASKKSEFLCPFGPSQLRRLVPKGQRNTNMVAVIPRAAHAFSVLALGWYVSRFQRCCRFAARKTGAFDSARSSMAQFSMGDRLLGCGKKRVH